MSCRVLAFVVSACLLAPAAEAQRLRPADEPLPVPGFAEALAQPVLALPAIPPPLEDGSTLGETHLYVRAFRFGGVTAFPQAELAALVGDFVGRELTPVELVRVRERVTAHYVRHGYLTSGAVIPNQVVEDGVVQVDVVEGVLRDVIVEGSRGLSEAYFRTRLQRAAGTPVDVLRLEERLRLLQRDGLVERIAARLVPGARRGQSVLELEVSEARPLALELFAANDQSPAVGSDRGALTLRHRNLTGRADVLLARVGASEGLGEWELRYRLPLGAADTELELRARRTRADVIERPLDELDVESESMEYGLALRHPLVRRPTRELWLSALGELRRSETSLLGRRFSFTAGPEDGVAKVTALRLVQEWTERRPDRVFAARSTLSFGLDLFDASDDPFAGSGGPDGTFFAWLGQLQYAWRLPERRVGQRLRDTQLLLRAEAQLTPDALLSLERFALGGRHSVRGYVENLLVRDRGWSASAELRVPVLRDELGRPRLELAPFADVGRAWNRRSVPGPETLASLGLGLRWRPSERLELAGYWGGKLRRVSRRASGLQGAGFHLELTWRAF